MLSEDGLHRRLSGNNRAGKHPNPEAKRLQQEHQIFTAVNQTCGLPSLGLGLQQSNFSSIKERCMKHCNRQRWGKTTIYEMPHPNSSFGTGLTSGIRIYGLVFLNSML